MPQLMPRFGVSLLCIMALIGIMGGFPARATAAPMASILSNEGSLPVERSINSSSLAWNFDWNFGWDFDWNATGTHPETLNTDYQFRKPSSDGIGKIYMGREISDVMGHRGAAWLERPSRRQTEQPWRILDALDIQPTDQIADIGAGTGYISFQLAEQVPEGTVFAVDIQPEMLDMLEVFQQERGVDNVQSILATPTDPNLPDGIDWVVMVDAYHEFEYPREVMTAVMNALNPGGKVVLAEYRGENPLIPIKRLHKMTERQVRRELESIGFHWVTTDERLPRQHLIVFQKS